MTTGWRVWKTFCMPAMTFRPSVPNSGPRWSMVGRLMAHRMRSGTGLGPGIWRKCRPVGWVLSCIGSVLHTKHECQADCPYTSRNAPHRNLHTNVADILSIPRQVLHHEVAVRLRQRIVEGQ